MCAKLKIIFFLLLWLCLYTGVIHTQEEPRHGQTQPSSQNSRPSSTASGNISETWNELFMQGQKIYETQKNDLAALTKELLSLRIGYKELTNLSARLSQSNADLNRYNLQIAERMQQRDEDLAAAYEREDELEKAILKKDNLILKMGIALGALVLIIIAAIVIKIYFRR